MSLLHIDRLISSKNPFKQLFVPFAALLVLFIIVSGVYLIYHHSLSKSPAQAISDLLSPVTMRNRAYESDGNYTVVTIAQGNAEQDNGPSATKQRDGKLPKQVPFWILSLVYILGATIFSGLLVASITNWYRSRSDKFKRGQTSYNFSGHTVILGYDDNVIGIIESLFAKNKQKMRIVVGVETNVPDVSDKLRSFFDERKNELVILEAHILNKGDLVRLKISKAKEVYIIGEHGDADNLNCYDKITDMCDGKEMPKCYVQMRHQSTFALFQTYAKKDGKKLKCFRAFNFNDEWARRMILGEYCNKEECRIDRWRIGVNTKKGVHLLILGMTDMGEALAREAAFLCHYPNFVKNGIKTTITFVDPEAEEKMSRFRNKYRHLLEMSEYRYRIGNDTWREGEHEYDFKDFLDIKWQFIQPIAGKRYLMEDLRSWINDEHQLLTIAVCTDNPDMSAAVALQLPDEVFAEQSKVPVWVYQPSFGSLADYLAESKFKNVVPFGMYTEMIDLANVQLIEKAKKLNAMYDQVFDMQNNKKYRQQEIMETPIEYDGPGKETSWLELAIYSQWSNVYNASAIEIKKRSIEAGRNGHEDRVQKLSKEEIELIAEVEHNRWNVEKLLLGYRAATEQELQAMVKDDDMFNRYKKHFVHRDIRPYVDLDDKTKIYDLKYSKELYKISDNE